MYRQGCIVWFDDSIGHFGRWDNGEGRHNSIRIFFTHFRDEQGSHSRTGTSTHRVGKLETLQAITRFCLFTHNIKYTIDKFCSFRVMPFSPVVTSSGLAENKVVRSEKLTVGSSSHRVHCTRFKIHQNCSRYVSPTSCFIVVDIDALKLQVGISMVCSSWIDAMFIRNNFPEFGTNLVTTLASLNMHNFSHGYNMNQIYTLIMRFK
mmetsp:Transcript_18951/g.24970  ORF Transcript_18951/g.24970 Transcript_18951/m.24970 type:complete len:206 (-) Transcript_18951:44-661(-)